MKTLVLKEIRNLNARRPALQNNKKNKTLQNKTIVKLLKINGNINLICVT